MELANFLFGQKPVTESDTACFYTRTPWVAPEAYLHRVFKPAPINVLSEVAARTRMPRVFVELLSRNNGANFFSDSLNVYGVVPGVQRLNRSDPLSLPPYNIETENRSWPPPDPDGFLAIGGYGFDGSNVCIDRASLEIVVYRRGEQTPYGSWPTLRDWLQVEIPRLATLFDTGGKRLFSSAYTLPCAIKH